MTSVIIGVRRIEQLSANLAATTIDVPADDLTALDDLTAPTEAYPNWMIRFQSRYRML